MPAARRSGDNLPPALVDAIEEAPCGHARGVFAPMRWWHASPLPLRAAA